MCLDLHILSGLCTTHAIQTSLVGTSVSVEELVHESSDPETMRVRLVFRWTFASHVFLDITENSNNIVRYPIVCRIQSFLWYVFTTKKMCIPLQKVLRVRCWNTFFERQHFYLSSLSSPWIRDCTICEEYNELEKNKPCILVVCVCVRQYAHARVGVCVCVCVYIIVSSRNVTCSHGCFDIMRYFYFPVYDEDNTFF